MNNREQERMKQLLRKSVAPVNEAELAGIDLWPAMQRRLHTESAPAADKLLWLDFALAGGLISLLAFSPALLPVLLYYL